MSSTPSSCAASSAPARQLTKYGSPFALGIIAITRRAPDGVAGPGEPATRGADVPAGTTERINQTLVLATMSAAAMMVAQTTAT